MEKSLYRKTLQSRVAKLQSKYNETQNKQEAAIVKLPHVSAWEQRSGVMKEWLEANHDLRKVEEQLRNTKRLLARAQGLHKAG